MLDREGADPELFPAMPATGGPIARGPRPAISATAAITSTHIRIWLGVVIAATAIGTAGYMVLQPGWRLLDALYMTVITLTTVGFREVGDLTDAGRIWTMILSLAGVGLIFGSVGIVAEYLVV